MNRSKPRLGARRFVPRPRLAIPIAILVVGASAGAWMLTWSNASVGPSHRLVPVARTTLSQPLPHTNRNNQGPGSVLARNIRIGGGAVNFGPG